VTSRRLLQQVRPNLYCLSRHASLAQQLKRARAAAEARKKKEEERLRQQVLTTFYPKCVV
jgi:hypothetical protein